MRARRTTLIASAAALVLAAGTVAAFVLRGDVAKVLPLSSPSPEVSRAPLLAAGATNGAAPTAAGLSRA